MDDFWRMVIEMNSSTVVMITTLEETDQVVSLFNLFINLLVVNCYCFLVSLLQILASDWRERVLRAYKGNVCFSVERNRLHQDTFSSFPQPGRIFIQIILRN